MPLYAYTGLPRHGKTYEVVSVVILGALRAGRRVVSNIAGLNYAAMRDLLIAEGVEPDKIGELVIVSHDDVKKPLFWRTDEDEKLGVESFIQLGDLVALDEIWRFFPKRGAIEPRAMNFFRMHGHMVHPQSGHICQIALISQSIRDFNENIREVIEQNFRMVKLTKVGLDGRYRVEIYERASVSKSDFVREIQRAYDKKYFSLYSSHSQKKEDGASADESRADDRGNALKSGFFKFMLPLALVMGVVGFYSAWRFFHPDPKPEMAKAKPDNSAPQAASAAPVRPPESSEWRAHGYVQSGGSVVYLVSSASMPSRFVVDPPGVKYAAHSLELRLPSGEMALSWSRPAASGSLGGMK